MTIARSLRILVMKIFVNVDQMQSVRVRQILVKTESAAVVIERNAPKKNIVTMENAKVCQFWFSHRLNCFFICKSEKLLMCLYIIKLLKPLSTLKLSCNFMTGNRVVYNTFSSCRYFFNVWLQRRCRPICVVLTVIMFENVYSKSNLSFWIY